MPDMELLLMMLGLLMVSGSLAGWLALAFPCGGGCIVYVTPAPLARWIRVIKNVLPTVQTIYYGALADERLRDPDR